MTLKQQSDIINENFSYLKENKQNVISDLDTIRSNATSGKSAKDTIDTYGDIVTHNTDEFQEAGDYATRTELNTKANDSDVVHIENEETITGKKKFTGGSGGSSSDVSIQTKNALAVGDETQTSYTGIYNHRKCSGDSNVVNTAGFLVNNDGSAKFTHKRGSTTAIGTADDSYIRFNSKTLVYSDSVNASSEKNILHTGNAYDKTSMDNLLDNKQENLDIILLEGATING